jgi:uncharacterized protein YlxW (UPF0749 family)
MQTPTTFDIVMLIISIAMSIIAAFSAVTGYLLRKLIGGLTEQVRELQENNKNLNNQVTRLTAIIDSQEKSCMGTHGQVNRRLDKHGEQIDELNVEVGVLNEKTKVL